jgi:hypothetical protein
MMKKLIIPVLLFAARGMAISGGVVMARSSYGLSLADSERIQTTQTQTTPASRFMQVVIGPSGSALVRGTVQSVGTSSVMISSWGGTWTVMLGSSTRILPQPLTSGSLADFAVGDLVGASGTAAQGQTLTINATVVRDWSKPARPVRPISQLFVGTASNIATSSFMLTTSNNVSYSVAVSSGTVIWDTPRRNIPYSDIQQGDTVRVQGILNGNTVAAQIVRDISR